MARFFAFSRSRAPERQKFELQGNHFELTTTSLSGKNSGQRLFWLLLQYEGLILRYTESWTASFHLWNRNRLHLCPLYHRHHLINLLSCYLNISTIVRHDSLLLSEQSVLDTKSAISNHLFCLESSQTMAAAISDNDNMLDGLNGEEPSEVEVAAETNRRNEMPSSIAT